MFEVLDAEPNGDARLLPLFRRTGRLVCAAASESVAMGLLRKETH